MKKSALGMNELLIGTSVSRGLRGYDKNSEDIRDNARCHPGKDRYQNPEQSKDHWVNIPILSQSTTNTREYLIRVAAIEMFDW